jgi:hypothetical protein
MNDYDPGDLPNDDPLERRRRRRRQWVENEVDDAWAAADEDDIPDDRVEIEDLAAGYVDEPTSVELAATSDDPLDEINPVDLGPLPASAQRLVQERRGTPARYSTSRARDIDPVPEVRKPHLEPKPVYHRPGMLSGISFWGIVLLVFLGFIALLVVILALASIATVL